MAQKKFLIIGRTATGKSTIAKGVCEELGLQLVKSYTTRPCRGVNDIDHLFITPDEVEQYKDNMVAYAKIGNYEYFVTEDILDDCDVYVIDPKGVEFLKSQRLNKYDFVEIYIRTTGDVSTGRALNRGDSADTLQSRKQAEDEQFITYEKAHSFHYHLLNNADTTIEDAVKKVCGWVLKELEDEE